MKSSRETCHSNKCMQISFDNKSNYQFPIGQRRTSCQASCFKSDEQEVNARADSKEHKGRAPSGSKVKMISDPYNFLSTSPFNTIMDNRLYVRPVSMTVPMEQHIEIPQYHMSRGIPVSQNYAFGSYPNNFSNLVQLTSDLVHQNQMITQQLEKIMNAQPSLQASFSTTPVQQNQVPQPFIPQNPQALTVPSMQRENVPSMQRENVPSMQREIIPETKDTITQEVVTETAPSVPSMQRENVPSVQPEIVPSVQPEIVPSVQPEIVPETQQQKLEPVLSNDFLKSLIDIFPNDFKDIKKEEIYIDVTTSPLQRLPSKDSVIIESETDSTPQVTRKRKSTSVEKVVKQPKKHPNQRMLRNVGIDIDSYDTNELDDIVTLILKHRKKKGGRNNEQIKKDVLKELDVNLLEKASIDFKGKDDAFIQKHANRIRKERPLV